MPNKYRVEPRGEACKTCGKGEQYAIVFNNGTEDVELSQTWGDREEADFICEELNSAFHEGYMGALKWATNAIDSHGVQAQTEPAEPVPMEGKASEVPLAAPDNDL